MQRPRLLIAFGILALLVVGAAIYWYAKGAGSPPPTPGTATGQALIGGPFTLVSQDGAEVTDRSLRGRYLLVFFGYTHCPDVCPLGLETISRAMDEVAPPVAARIQPVFITFDPKRDTMPVMRDYVASFRPGFLALTGSEEQVAAATRAYRVYVQKDEAGADGDYAVNHSTFTYVMGPDGNYLTHFSPGTTPEDMATRLAELVGPGSATS